MMSAQPTQVRNTCSRVMSQPLVEPRELLLTGRCKWLQFSEYPLRCKRTRGHDQNKCITRIQLFLDRTRPLRAVVDTVVDPDGEAHTVQVFREGIGVFGVLMAVTDKDVAHQWLPFVSSIIRPIKYGRVLYHACGCMRYLYGAGMASRKTTVLSINSVQPSQANAKK